MPCYQNSTSTIPSGIWPTQTVVPCGTYWINSTTTTTSPTAATTVVAIASGTATTTTLYMTAPPGRWVAVDDIHRVTEQELIEQDQASYRRALSEHNEQEAQRLLRQIAERERMVTERRIAQAAAQAQQREEAERQHAAKQLAQEFLLTHLNPSQQETYKKNGWFVVEGGRSKTKYRIRAVDNMAANVDVIVSDKLTHRLCAHVPVHKVPLGDQLLAQKMMLEFSEDDFLRIANRH